MAVEGVRVRGLAAAVDAGLHAARRAVDGRVAVADRAVLLSQIQYG